MKINSITNYSPKFTSTAHRYENPENSDVPIYCITSFLRNDTNWGTLALDLAEKYKDVPKAEVLDLACSDGSETYSLAMILDEKLGENSKKFFPIKGYDLNPDVISRANKDNAILSTNDYYTIAKQYKINFEKYFNPNGICFDSTINDKIYFINPNLKEMVTFECKDALDVLKELPDNCENTVIFFKNALTYIKPQKREAIYNLLGQKLGKNSILILGTYDTLIYNEILIKLAMKDVLATQSPLIFEKHNRNDNQQASYSDYAKAQALFRLD